MADPETQRDPDCCYLSISPGGGHAEVQAWAAMLYRMYQRFAERHGFGLQVLSAMQTEEGISEATFRIDGEGCTKQLAGEHGVHSLVRISPFDASQRRHTSFASVECVAGLLETSDFDLDMSDVQITGAGPCGVVEATREGPSAPVRVTHNSTRIAVTCTDGSHDELVRRAMQYLRAKVYIAFAPRRKEGTATDSGLAWGSSMRKYVLDPFEKVEDMRLQIETTDAAAVLDGDLSLFLNR